jgi:hypothetical protein
VTTGKIPSPFVVTLPKVVSPEQVGALVDLFDILESQLNIARGSLKLELMVEAPQAVLGQGGELVLPKLIQAAEGRCAAVHFGPYDYTASLGITATYQTMTHPACDFARHIMQVSLAGSGVWLSDGATNVLPVSPHRVRSSSAPLSERDRAENKDAIHRAWRFHYDQVQSSLARGFYQGWDLHPAQLVTRYAALYQFFLEGLEPAAERLRAFIDMASRATLTGNVFDDAATGQGLLNYFLRASECGAITEEEARSITGLSPEELRGRSFAAIVERRRAG